MSRTVQLFQMVRPDTDPVSMGLIGFKNGDTLASLRSKLETTCVFSSFQFWDARVSSPLHPKLESIIFVEKCEGKVFLFETAEFPSTSKRDSSASVVTGFDTVDATDPNTRSSTPELTVGSALVSVSCETTLPGEVENYGGKLLLQSRRMSKHAVEIWRDQVEKLIKLVQKCLKLLEDREDAQQERTLGTRLYLEVVADYIDIFYSTKLDLFSRVVNCAKVSFFFRLWRLWLLRDNHTVSGVIETLSEKNMVSIECWYDVQMSCHMVVLLCVLFRDKFSGLKVLLHLLGSDCCEHFFSRVGGMSGYERNYGFGDLIDCASGLNRLASMEYGEENIHFGRSHAKQQTIWGKLHLLLASETEPDLSDFNRLQTGAEVIEALKKGFDEAQNLLIQLNMAPHAGVRNQAWWKTPWIIERELRLFERGSETSAVPMDTECDEVGGDDADLSGPVDLWDLSTDVQGQGSDGDLQSPCRTTQHSLILYPKCTPARLLPVAFASRH
ncbi:hypothetical protein R1sor_016849 [Riccia sorocarpa]|uniref:Uncharacterized protein n=1 Tax=Riccia sorocarpa TaxID=122646 RepID=A0ABD3HG27_9MARC